MTRPLIGLLVLACAVRPVQGQGAACTYDTCALRLQHRFFSGVSLVQGKDGSRVARLGLFAPRVGVLAAASDSAKAHYLAFRSHQNRGAALTLVGLSTAIAVGALAYDESHYRDNKGLVWGLIGVGLTFSIWGGANVVKANDQLQRSIWFYNRDLAGR
jgi:hypothetical protein